MTGNVDLRGPGISTYRKEGFAYVADWAALDRDNETFIYRKFDELAARNLLYLQSELFFLEKRLNEFDKNDANSEDMDLKDAARTWETLIQRHGAGNEEAQARMDLILRIRGKLREYRRFDEKSISIAVAVISILVAALLLVGSITGLYFVTNDGAKLGMVATFTAMFALSVGLMTTARRVEIFAATVAYSAVLVVFVSGNISNEQEIPLV
ncbi:unnamed protein product [Clonostachys rosea]|uniref:DUF6594 domain-containing protein n=1 Tax=Bionectria ochroleuca TaxID=29856 RepID=A0ABY6UIY6_BIOOC|nr:unnamed protein product [Clonostachys rosea]